MKALIVGDSTGALAAARELGCAGWTVGVASGSRFGWAPASRWTARWHHVPPLVGDPGGFIEAINQASEEHGYEVVFPTGDAELLALSIDRDKLTPIVPYAPHPCVIRAVDKVHLEESAHKAGMRTPLMRPADKTALDEFSLPVVVKSRLHWTPGMPNRQVRVAAVVAHSREEALRRAAIMRSVGAEPLFQEFVPGSLAALVVLADKKHRIVSQHIQLTTYDLMSESGQSARATSPPVPEALLAKVQKILIENRWFGMANFQFIFPDDGDPPLIDFNGRPYGSYALAHGCGMRAMDAWARLATGRSATARAAVAGPRYQALEGDLRRALREPGLKRIPELLGCVVESFATVHPILSWSDPLPLMAYLARLPRRALSVATEDSNGASRG